MGVALEPTTFGDVTEIWAARAPHRVALRDKAGRELSYAALEERTSRLAQALLGQGLQPGDRIATWMVDSFAYVEVYLAAAKAGLVVCPINQRHTAAEADYLIADSDARLVLHSPALAYKVAALDQQLMAARGKVSIGETAGQDTTELDALLHDVPAQRPAVQVAPDSPFIIGYTSGTTGRPKGAVLSHRAVLTIARMNATSYRLGAYPQVALTGSMSFVSVVPAHVLCTLRLGGTLTIMGSWEVDELMTVLDRDLITFVYIPSPRLTEVTEALAAQPQAWRNLRSVLHSASRARPEQLLALTQVIGARLVEGWGMTENAGGLMTATLGHEMLDAHDEADPVFETVGLPVLDVEVRVVGEDGQELPHDGQSVGELWFRSPAIFSAYWNREQATVAAFQDDWFRSDDLGSIDAQGYVSLSERRTDLIVSGGANVYPKEVEDCIARLPGVVDVAVVGLEHERWGHTVVAAVVAEQSDAPLTEARVIEHCRGQLASYKKPTQVYFMDSLPRTPSQKVSRAAIREQLRKLNDRSVGGLG